MQNASPVRLAFFSRLAAHQRRTPPWYRHWRTTRREPSRQRTSFCRLTRGRTCCCCSSWTVAAPGLMGRALPDSNWTWAWALPASRNVNTQSSFFIVFPSLLIEGYCRTLPLGRAFVRARYASPCTINKLASRRCAAAPGWPAGRPGSAPGFARRRRRAQHRPGRLFCAVIPGSFAPGCPWQ